MNLLLLRGLVRDQRCWGDFPEKLKLHAPHLKPYFLDLPGTGTEYLRSSPTSLSAIRIDVAKRFHEKIAQGQFPKGPWTLLAISMGAMVGIDWVDAEPTLFEKLIVINSSSSDIASLPERFSLKFLPRVLAALVTGTPEDFETLIMTVSSNRYAKGDPQMMEALARHIRFHKEKPVARATFFRQVFAASRYRLPTTRPKPKTAVYSSEGDQLVSPLCSTRLADRFGVKKISHPWAGHDLPLEDPEWLAKSVSEWMASPV